MGSDSYQQQIAGRGFITVCINILRLIRCSLRRRAAAQTASAVLPGEMTATNCENSCRFRFYRRSLRTKSPPVRWWSALRRW